jgi:hypothetical protein
MKTIIMAIKFDKVLDDIKIADYNNRKIVLSTQSDGPIRFQIPKMYMPFGISGFTPEIGNKKFNIDSSNNVMKFFEASKIKLLTASLNKVKRSLTRR